MIALVLGGAPSVWSDVADAKALLNGRRHITVACNDAGAKYDGHLDAFVSLHPEHLERWAKERTGNQDYRRFRPVVFSGPAAEVVEERWPGSSGLYALQVALMEMGAAAAILCGVPMDQQAGHFTHDGPWAATTSYRQDFIAALPHLGARTRSMGGWTGELFGRPTPTWIAAAGAARPLAPPRPLARTDHMYRVENISGSHQRFFVRGDDGTDRLVHLAHGQSGEFDIDPLQVKFQPGGPFKVTAVKTAEPEPAKAEPAEEPAPAAKPTGKATLSGHRPL